MHNKHSDPINLTPRGGDGAQAEEFMERWVVVGVNVHQTGDQCISLQVLAFEI